MEDIDSSPLVPISPNLRKRVAPADYDHENDENARPLNLKGSQFMMPTPPETEGSSNASPPERHNDGRAVSPAPSSISTLSSLAMSSTNNAATEVSDGVQRPPSKKRKLSPAEALEKKREKEARAVEKEEKLKLKAEEKARKDEEKAKRDDEKRKKAEEREEKRREKELEEERKAQEKLKKERSQMRLGAFFQRPDTPAKSPLPNGDRGPGLVRRKSLSLEPFDAVADQLRCSASPLKSTPLKRESTGIIATPMVAERPVSDYRKHFLPFVPPSHSSVAPEYTISNRDDLAYWQGMFDRELQNPTFQEKIDLGIVQPGSSFDHLFKPQVMRGIRTLSVRTLVDRIQGTSQEPIDLTKDMAPQNPMEALQAVSRRLLQFHQDVRPPWFGTYTKIVSIDKARKLTRNPFTRARPDTDYDYDSEAEWEEPEEGEDIDLDEDDEAESLGDADEMEEFLDDEEDMIKSKRKMVTGDLKPTSTGLCWEDQAGRISSSIEGDQSSDEMRGMRIGFLIPGFTGNTIDPFCTSYWTNHMEPPGAPVVDSSAKASKSSTTTSRPPLVDRINPTGPLQPYAIGAAEGTKGPITSISSSTGAKRGPKPKPRTLDAQVMDEFKEAVVGSQLGKLELLKGLKLRFPKLTHETIKETLGSHFAQVGNSKADKKWVYVEPS